MMYLFHYYRVIVAIRQPRVSALSAAEQVDQPITFAGNLYDFIRF
jgi:hypothetical protein